MKRTIIEFDDSLMAKAMEISGYNNRRAAVEA